MVEDCGIVWNGLIFFINLIFHLVKFFVCLFVVGGGWGLHYRYNLDQLTLIKPAVVRS